MFEFIIKYMKLLLLNIIYFINWLFTAPKTKVKKVKRKKSKERKEQLSKEEFDEWKISTYANNRNLYHIPRKRLDLKRSEIRKKHGLK